MDAADANAIQRGSPAASRLPAALTDLLSRLSDGLRTLYGERYRGLVLYGSYARGEADEGSDVDLLLLLDGEVDTVQEVLYAQEIKWPLALEADYAVSLLPVSLEEYLNSKEPFLWNARREGFPAT